jgi:hypothetical protein
MNRYPDDDDLLNLCLGGYGEPQESKLMSENNETLEHVGRKSTQLADCAKYEMTRCFDGRAKAESLLRGQMARTLYWAKLLVKCLR